MIRRWVAGDSVAIAGSVIGLVSLLLGWLTLKPNRIVSGTGLGLFDSFGVPGTIVIVLLWIVCFALALRNRGKGFAMLIGGTANLILILTFVFSGSSASRLLISQEPFARVSLNAGLWVTLAGVYVVIHSTRRMLTGFRFRQNLVSWFGLITVAIMLLAGWLNNLSVLQEFMGREGRFFQELRNHIYLFGSSVAIGTLIGVPLGIWATRSKKAERPIFFITNITQTIPSLALFGLMIAPLSVLSFNYPFLRELGIRGVGTAPAMIALVIYSLLPIVRNTYVGLRQLDHAVIDAGLGMGMNRWQVFRGLELPLAAPLVLEGVRTAAVQSVGLATVAALIGAGGLGWFIFQGLGQAATDMIILGVIPIIALALIVDSTMRVVVRLFTPKGLMGGN